MVDIKFIHGDCLEEMPKLADKSIDMILCDLPYGTTACKWDTIIPFEPLWTQYKRLIKDNGAIVLTASQPFTSALIASNIKMFKYEWIWDKKSKQEVLIAQKANIEAKIKELEDTLTKEQKTSDDELNALRDAYKSFQEQIKANEELLKQADEINSAAERETEIQGKIDANTVLLDKLTDETSKCLEEYNRTLLELNTIQATITQIQHDADKLEKDDEILRLKNDIKTAESQVAILQKRDPNCQSATCSFIVAALEAQDKLPELNKAFSQREEEVFKLTDKLHGAHFENKSKWTELAVTTKGMKEKVDTTDAESSNVRKGLATLRFDLTKVKELAGKKTALEVAKSQYESVTRQMEENATKGKELKIKWEQRKSDLDGSINDAKDSLSDIKGKIDNEITVRIEQIQDDIKKTDLGLFNTERDTNYIRSQIMKYEADLSARAEVEKEIQTVMEEKKSLTADIVDWTYLRNSCGKNGLQAMEIDGAAPIITSFANDLLMQAFGPVFTVKFRTINDEGKECLDIIIINGDGEEVLLDNLSGGQKIWNLIALRQGMTLLSKEKSGKNFGSFFSDEMDGPLDPENAVNFINMYRSFMKFGGFEDGFFISHKPECRSLADHTLMFEAGKNPYWN